MINSNQQKIESENFSDSTKIPNQNSAKIQSFRNQKENRTDPVQILLTIVIFAVLAIGVYYLMGPISMVAMAIGGVLSFYHLLGSRRTDFTKIRKGRRGPSFLLLVLMGTPFLLGGLVAFEGISLLESPSRIILLFGMTISFWTTMLFVPMAVMSRSREERQPEPNTYPPVSIIIPAYNEEKVVLKTIEAAIETQYPKKEVIFVDDGSSDNTLKIASQFKNQIKVLHKENGGKASAINYGIVYSKGEIIVILDADTIIGRRAITEIVKGFQSDENVAAVAGNIKVKNRTNWLTKCQALEYIIGIQIIRRAFDVFGSISIVPGALGAFRKEFVQDAGTYDKDTIVEDFDQTIKLLKAGMVTQGSIQAVAYSESPDTMDDFVKQRKRWYRGNIQVLTRHSDALINPRFGYLQKLSFPFLMLGMVVTPIIGFASFANVIFGVFTGDLQWVLEAVSIFFAVHILMTTLALRIDKEDYRLLIYSPLLLFGFKQIVDTLLVRALFEHASGKKAVWTSAKRIGG